MRLKYRIAEITNGLGDTWYRVSRYSFWSSESISGKQPDGGIWDTFKDREWALKAIDEDFRRIKFDRKRKVINVKYEYIIKTTNP